MSFFAPQCAFEGFRVVRRHPGAFLVWTLLLLGCVLAGAGIFYLASGPALSDIVQSHGADIFAPGVLDRLTPGLLAIYPLVAGFIAVLDAAVFRAVLRPYQRGFAYLAFGADELRLILICVVSDAVDLAGQNLLGMLHRALVAAGAPSLPLSLVLGLAYFCLYAWVTVRMCLWSVQAVAERRLDPLGAFRLTAGRFWSLLAMYLIVVALAIGCLAVVVVASVIIGGGSGALMTLAAPGGGDPGDLKLTLVTVLRSMQSLSTVAVVLVSTLFAAAFAAAYRGLVAADHRMDTAA